MSSLSLEYTASAAGWRAWWWVFVWQLPRDPFRDSLPPTRGITLTQGRSLFLLAVVLSNALGTWVYSSVKWSGVPRPLCSGLCAVVKCFSWVKRKKYIFLRVSSENSKIGERSLALLTAVPLIEVFVGLHTLWTYWIQFKNSVKSCRFFISWWIVQ